MNRPLSSIVLLLAHFAVARAADLPKPEEYNANWPRFRGPGGNGVCVKSDAPLTCDIKDGKNIIWTADVPLAGFSSPVTWGGRVFLSGADKGTRGVMCYDLPSGKILWQSSVTNTTRDEAPDQSGMASSTVATDGLRVYAMFANGDLAAFDFEGKVIWSKNLGVPKNPYGHACSLLTWQDRVIVQFDQGEADEKLSKLCAFDGATGTVVWEKPREVGASWATPISIDVSDKPQIITLGVPWVISYSPGDGQEIWRAECLDGEVTPSPVFAGGTLFVIHPSSKLQTIRPDGSGDVTKTHLDWSAEDGIPDITSPVSNGGLVFLIDTGGVLTCYDAKNGKKQWTHDFEEAVNASPSIVGDHLYLITKKGTLIVVETARDFKEIARSTLSEQVLASPAFAQNKILVRGMKHLICIGVKVQNHGSNP